MRTVRELLLLLVWLVLQDAQAFAAPSPRRQHRTDAWRQPQLQLPRRRPSPGRAVGGGGDIALRLHPAAAALRGGATAAAPAAGSLVASAAAAVTGSPQALFNASLAALGGLILVLQFAGRGGGTGEATGKPAPPDVRALQARFLGVFWLLRMSDWLQGPYFYEVYASKIFDGVPASMTLVSRLFLTGFASTALFGPSVGRLADTYGTKRATVAFCLIYALGALSTQSPLLQVLVAGRVLSGIGTSLLFSAPEAWLVSEATRGNATAHLGETFGLAYAGDSLVAIGAGQLAAVAAQQRGPTGPFELSTAFLGLGGALCALLWREHRAPVAADARPTVREALQVIWRDPKIALVGGVQSLFEAAMYIFVLQWPPAFSAAINGAFGGSITNPVTPYGTIFSCFMASCLLGSTIFGQATKRGVRTETFTSVMLLVATVAMSAATLTVQSTGSLGGLMAALFVFEACVGMYFPSIGTLRSRYIPDSHRSVIMNLFGIPLNVLVVGVFLSIDKLGLGGALTISSSALAMASLCMLKVRMLNANSK